MSADTTNPCDKIFDHKWLDPVCVEDGCCSLMLGYALKAYVKAQRQMLEKWSECDDAKRTELWRNLHSCEDAARDALERWGR